MQKMTAAKSLKVSILVLEQRQIEEEKLVREQFSIIRESLKPLNILRKVINEITGPSELKDKLFQTTTGLISGYLSRKILVRSSKNPLLRFAGFFLQYGITRFVSNNSASIKTMGHRLIKKLFPNLREHKS